MVTTVAALLVREMEALGCRITVQQGVPSISRPKSPWLNERFEALVAGLKQHREEVLTLLQGQRRELCPVCKQDISDPEFRERLAYVNPFCSRGQSAPPQYRNGVMTARARAGCPYRMKGW